MMFVIKIIALVELIFVGVILISKTLEEKKEKKEKETDNVVVKTTKTGTVKTGTIGTAYPNISEFSHAKVDSIVRCKDCKYYYYRPGIGSYCALYNMRQQGDDWFCAGGKKKVDGGKRLIDVDELMEYLRRN